MCRGRLWCYEGVFCFMGDWDVLVVIVFVLRMVGFVVFVDSRIFIFWFVVGDGG